MFLYIIILVVQVPRFCVSFLNMGVSCHKFISTYLFSSEYTLLNDLYPKNPLQNYILVYILMELSFKYAILIEAK